MEVFQCHLFSSLSHRVTLLTNLVFINFLLFMMQMINKKKLINSHLNSGGGGGQYTKKNFQPNHFSFYINNIRLTVQQHVWPLQQ